MKRNYIVLAAIVLVGGAGCSSAREESETTSADALTGNELTAQGFAFVRTDTFQYDVSGIDAASGLVCTGGPEGRICYSVMEHQDDVTVTGKADRYQHPDGRLAYLVADNRVIGPVMPGTYTGSGDNRSGSATLRILDLVLTSHGEVELSVNYSAKGWFPVSGGSVFTYEGGEAMLPLTSAGAFNSETTYVFTTPDGKGVQQFWLGFERDHYNGNYWRRAMNVMSPRRTATSCIPFACIKTSRQCTGSPNGLGECHDAEFVQRSFKDKAECKTGCTLSAMNPDVYGTFTCIPDDSDICY